MIISKALGCRENEVADNNSKEFIKITIFLALIIASITSSQVLAVQFAHRVYDANGNRIGTCRKDPYGRTLRLYDNNDKLVKNPEMYRNISDAENYLFVIIRPHKIKSSLQFSY